MTDGGSERFRNPIINADMPDPDVIRYGDGYVMVTSSMNHVPGLPVLRSADLVHWRIVAHAVGELLPREYFALPRPGGGMWAPSIRHHGGRLWIFAPDPDQGIFVLTAERPEGPWSPPRMLMPGLGLIDPCPFWDDDGRAWLVFAWAGSRSGVRNRLSMVEIAPDASRVLGSPVTVIDGDALPGCTTLEGPKLYKRDGFYWIFAPAGGVTHGWQLAFRARSILGPYEGRTVLRQGATGVNGPHQGAWVGTPEGADWFLHFQDRGPFGRVTHLQPMRWDDEGWPVLGTDGEPVLGHAAPLPSAVARPQRDDDFATTSPGLQWHWQANPGPDWYTLRGDGFLRLRAIPNDVGNLRSIGQVLGQSLPGDPSVLQTTVTLQPGEGRMRAGVVVLGRSYAWIGLERYADGCTRVAAGTRTPSPDGTGSAMEVDSDRDEGVAVDRGMTSAEPVGLRVVTTAEGSCTLGYRRESDDGWIPLVEDFAAEAGHWAAAQLGLFATAPVGADGTGVAWFGSVTVGDLG